MDYPTWRLRRWQVAILLVFCAQATFIAMFMKEMHTLMPLNKNAHYGQITPIALVLYWYLSPLPLVCVCAFTLMHSRARGGTHEDVRFSTSSWIVLILTMISNVIAVIFTRQPGDDSELFILEYDCWSSNNLYLTLTISCAVVIVMLTGRLELQMTRDEIEELGGDHA
ncbi:Uncharacterized protein PBTT_08809 [Plasmodiophora brassicae]|uniref:Uncharacterized protein n=1 Tax=Plasmodiophora brassicae TaxID=37360 RepID=A0A3P3YKI4_PLABS|nr:unnamed protein product [Plasmodiophora brassicae]